MYLTLEEFDPFFLRTIDEEITVTVRQCNDFSIDKFGFGGLDAFVLRIKVIHMDGKMVHSSFGRQLVAVPLN